MIGRARTITRLAEWKPRCWVAGQTGADGRPTDRWESHNVEVDGVTLILSTGGTEVWRTTGANRSVVLDPMITEVRRTPHDPDREYVLRLEPRADELSDGPAGPTTGVTTPPGSARLFDPLFRPLEITFTFDADFKIVDPQVRNDETERGPHGMAVVHENSTLSTTTQTLDIDWKPDWLRRGRFRTTAMTRPASRSRGRRVASVLILHRTGLMGPTLNTFTAPRLTGVRKGIHYVVDIDGHVVKMCHEDLAVNHSGHAGWRGATPLGNHSVGIEHINRDQDPFPEAQIVASVHLVGLILAARSIDRWNVAGHADVKTLGLGRPMALDPVSRIACPGSHFFWDRLEDEDLALRARADAPLPADPYGYFSDPSHRALRRNDRDRTRRYGGRRFTAAEIPTNSIIADIHRDLNRIGWSPILRRPNGDFDDRMEQMVIRLQLRFRITPADGRVDRTTAERLLQVIAELDRLGAP